MSKPARNTQHRDHPINIRATQRQRDVIDLAARTVGKSRSDFMLEAACRAAEDVIIDQRLYVLDADTFDQIAEMIDTPAPPSDDLRRLMARKPRWE